MMMLLVVCNKDDSNIALPLLLQMQGMTARAPFMTQILQYIASPLPF